MRISDWSSDVCSSDLAGLAAGGRAAADREPRGGAGAAVGAGAGIGRDRAGRDGLFALAGTAPALAARRRQRARSEERRVGKECVTTLSARWAPYPSKNNHTQHIMHM